MRVNLRKLLLTTIIPICTATPIKANQIIFTSGAATYYTNAPPNNPTVEFDFSFSRPLQNNDYFVFGGTNPNLSSEFFIVSYRPLAENSEIEYCNPVCETIGNFSHSVIANNYNLTVNYSDLGISVPVFQVAGDVGGPYPAKMDSFGVDFPVYSAINVPQVHLSEPSGLVYLSIVAAAAFFHQFSAKKGRDR